MLLRRSYATGLVNLILGHVPPRLMTSISVVATFVRRDVCMASPTKHFRLKHEERILEAHAALLINKNDSH